MRKGSVKRGLVLVTAVATSMAMTVTAFAADALYIEGQGYFEAANGEGSGGGTWNWDGAEALALDNFKTEIPIYSQGDLTVTLTGENETAGIIASDYDTESGDTLPADLTITGGGSLNVSSEYTGIVSTGDITIEGTTVNVAVEGEEAYAGINTYQGDVTIKDSTVTVDVKNTSGDEGIDATGIVGENVNIDHSDVTVKLSPDGIAVHAHGADEYSEDEDGNGSFSHVSDGKITLTNARIKTDGMEIRDVLGFSAPESKGQIIAKGSGVIDFTKEGMTEEEYEACLKEMKTSGVEIVKVNAATNTATSPKTGDTTQLPLYGTMAAVAGLGLVLLLKAKFAR